MVTASATVVELPLPRTRSVEDGVGYERRVTVIPLKLTLRNFLCYGETAPSLDLEGVHLACLCGRNGHGKSALLDAMSWALWGKARGRSQDELIHYGRDEMMVDLEFQARDTRYRVTRRHSSGTQRKRHGASDLQLQVLSDSDASPITGNTIRETQLQIDQITGMDYETFVNSAFLLQGRADEFTNKTPGERKEVLAKILGLDYYDLLQSRARSLGDAKKVEAAVAGSDLERMRIEISRAERYRTELDVLASDIEDVSGQIEGSRQTLYELRAQVEDLSRKQKDLDDLRMRIPAIESELSGLEEEIGIRKDRISGYEVLLKDRETIERGLEEFKQVRGCYEELNQSREGFDSLVSQQSQLETQIEGARARLEERLSQLKRRIDEELRPKAESAATIPDQLTEARVRLDELAKEDRNLDHGRHTLQQLASEIGKFQADSERLKAEGQELRSKQRLVQSSHGSASCPLCGTELGTDACFRLLESYVTQIDGKLELYNQNQKLLSSAQERKGTLESELPKSEESLRGLQSDTQSAIALLERRLEEGHRAAVDLDQAGRDLAEEKLTLEDGAYAAQQRDRLAELGEEVTRLGYDQSEHRRLYNEMRELQPFEERYARLKEASLSLPQEEAFLVRAEETCLRRRDDIASARVKISETEGQLVQLPESEEKLRRADESHRDLELRHGELFRRQVEAEGELRRLEVLEGEIEVKERTLRAVRNDQGIYQELTDAFGRRGVQAMLIDTVLPSIEEEANTLLGRMTDGRMHVKLETQRQRRSGRGEPIETLEINISDEMGPRSYELFSGGEAFRINLALRIALSKVLARRRGAPLPTLFIDEGFGTQDAAGRERILDVIGAIEKDFEKIIVISHLDEIRDAFDVRIEVQKEEAGSTFWVS